METTRDPGLDGVTPFRFACHRCGNCCSGASGFVWLEAGEVERMSTALGTTMASFSRRFVRSAVDPRTGEHRLALIETAAEGGRCALLVGKHTCSVYEARPEHCRTFPYWDSVLEDAAAFEVARATCPGIAVVVDDTTRSDAFAALAELHARLADDARATCCLASDSVERTYATALEVDYALASESRSRGAYDLESITPALHFESKRNATSVPPDSRNASECRFGKQRPMACRAGVDGETALREVRLIERATNYPAAYAPLAELLKTREVQP